MRLAACLSAAFALLLAACEASGGSADLVIHGGPIHTADGAQPMVEAVAVRGGVIIHAGDLGRAERLIGPDTRVIHLGGRAMYPGFTDSHVHVMGVGERERLLNLEGTPSLEALVERVRAAAAALPAGGVLYGRGWIETHWPEARFPTRRDLDAAAPDHAVVLVRADGHALAANSLALERAGISADSEAPEGGDILRDEAGEPTGMLIDAAMYPVRALVERPRDPAERAEVYREGARVLASYGWTGGHDMSVPWADVAMIEGLAASGRLRLRVYVSANPDGLAPLAEGGPREAGNGRMIARAVKMYMDGALGSRGAALLAPYADAPDTDGLLLLRPEEADEAFRTALRAGVQMNVHAIGDRGNRLLLDRMQAALEAVPEDERAVPDPRWRVEHAQVVHPDDIGRFAELGIIPSMQPSHAIGDLYFAPARLGPDRLDGAYAWRSIIDSGSIIAGGSDAPVERGEVRIEFYAAVARRGLDGYQDADWRPEQAVTRQEALRMFTLWPARASFREDELGSISVGKRADFSVFDRDLMTVPEREILQARPVMTIIDGQVVWRAD